jgi:homoserine O-acetyltransferase
VLRDPAWHGGHYAEDEPPRNGMRLARKIGTITYRSATEWNERFGRLPVDASRVTSMHPNSFAPEFAIEGYLEWQAERFVKAFDPNCYLYLSRAMDRFDLSAHGEPAALFARAGLESALVIGVESDLLFPIGEQGRIAAALAAAEVPTTFARLDCREGHDAFLVDIPAFDAVIRRYLDSTDC